jgi:histone deacetylase 1/2
MFVGKYSYYVSFIDDFSKFTWIYLLKKPSKVYQVFLNFQALAKQKFGTKIITMQTDWGGEYEKLHGFFNKIGITHHVSCPHAHQLTWVWPLGTHGLVYRVRPIMEVD